MPAFGLPFSLGNQYHMVYTSHPQCIMLLHIVTNLKMVHVVELHAEQPNFSCLSPPAPITIFSFSLCITPITVFCRCVMLEYDIRCCFFGVSILFEVCYL